jgi:UDP-N-acetylglucosamine 4,6-dehydratase
VRDSDRLRYAFHEVDVVVHAAALKQVPMLEYNPFEAVKTNVIGASHVIDAAITCGVDRVVALSTDKAVNPINIYGATKLCAEKLFVDGNAYAGSRRTRFSVVRYGNVVGSRGSVTTLFRKQAAGGTLEVTDKRMTRFWLTLNQGVEFVLQCVASMKGGEIFVPKVPSMRVVDLASALAPGCQIKYVGIRPGEKLHEVLVTEDEARHSLEFDGFFVIKPENPQWRYESWTGGKPLPDGFRYCSDQNSAWVTADALVAMVDDE